LNILYEVKQSMKNVVLQTHESYKKSLASIHHPASHKEISPTTLYSEKVNVTAKYMNPHLLLQLMEYLYKKSYKISHNKLRYYLG